jgi:hypothetical protein
MLNDILRGFAELRGCGVLSSTRFPLAKTQAYLTVRYIASLKKIQLQMLSLVFKRHEISLGNRSRCQARIGRCAGNRYNKGCDPFPSDHFSTYPLVRSGDTFCP